MSSVTKGVGIGRLRLPDVSQTRLLLGGLAVVLLLGALLTTTTVITGRPPWQAFGSGNGGHNGTAYRPDSAVGPGASPSSGVYDPSASPSPGGSPDASAGGGSPDPNASPTPNLHPTPTDNIAGKAHLTASYCGGGYEPGDTCKITYTGVYYLSEPVGQVEVRVTIDGTVADTHTYTAPHGSKAFESVLTFTVPQHAHNIDYQAFLKDPTGKILAQTLVQHTQGYG